MYLVIKKTKRSPHSKITDQTTLSFSNFELLSQHLLREGTDNCVVFEAKKIKLGLVELNSEEEVEENVSE